MDTITSQAISVLNRTREAPSRGRKDDLDPEMEILQTRLRELTKIPRVNREEIREILTRMILWQMSKSGGFEFREYAKLVLDLQGLKSDSRFKKGTADDVILPEGALNDALKGME